MFEELFESVTGPVGLGILLLLAFPGSRQAVRGGVKTLMKTGLEITDYFREIRDEVEQERKFYGEGPRITDKVKLQ